MENNILYYIFALVAACIFGIVYQLVRQAKSGKNVVSGEKLAGRVFLGIGYAGIPASFMYYLIRSLTGGVFSTTGVVIYDQKETERDLSVMVTLIIICLIIGAYLSIRADKQASKNK